MILVIVLFFERICSVLEGSCLLSLLHHVPVSIKHDYHDENYVDIDVSLSILSESLTDLKST